MGRNDTQLQNSQVVDFRNFCFFPLSILLGVYQNDFLAAKLETLGTVQK